MSHREPEADDPMTLEAVGIPASREDVEAMARGFAEEYAFWGWDEGRILELFRHPFYAGPHLAMRQLGEPRIREIVAEAVSPWRNRHG
jgi:hypothetical protein